MPILHSLRQTRGGFPFAVSGVLAILGIVLVRESAPEPKGRQLKENGNLWTDGAQQTGLLVRVTAPVRTESSAVLR